MFPANKSPTFKGFRIRLNDHGSGESETVSYGKGLNSGLLMVALLSYPDLLTYVFTGWVCDSCDRR